MLSDLEIGCKYLSAVKNPPLFILEEINAMNIVQPAKAGFAGAVIHRLSAENNQYVWELVGLDEPSKIETSFTISIDKPDVMLQAITESTYPIIKIKMGFDDDEELVKLLAMITGKTLRVDANGGWNREQAEKMIFELSRIGVELIEQPTDIKYIRDWKYLKGHCKCNLFLDEGLESLEDYIKYADYIDGVNIKMAKSGGIFEAMKIAEVAGRDHRKVMLGCMVESPVGLSQAVYLSSMADCFDLDGPLLLADNIADGISYNREKIEIDDTIIGGPKLKKEYIEEALDA